MVNYAIWQLIVQLDMEDYLAANRTINKATNQATNMTANRTANLAANMATNVTAKVTAHKATSMVQGIGQGCIRVRTWLHASHHCGKLELSLTNEQTITYDETCCSVYCMVPMCRYVALFPMGVWATWRGVGPQWQFAT